MGLIDSRPACLTKLDYNINYPQYDQKSHSHTQNGWDY